MPPKAVPHPKPSRPNATHQADTAAALADYERRTAKTGRTFKARAVATGFYGIPVPALKQPGEVFLFAVKDLTPWEAGKRHADGKAHEKITIDGVDYALPSWVEDAKKAPPPADDDAFENDDDDVLSSAGAHSTDSVL